MENQQCFFVCTVEECVTVNIIKVLSVVQQWFLEHLFCKQQ